MHLSFSINGQTLTNKLEATDSFNDFISKIGETTRQNVPTTKHNFQDYIPDLVQHTMFLEPVIPSTITKTTRKLKYKSSFGHDGISSKILKHYINVIAVPITHIINRARLAPDKLKLAKVIIIFSSCHISLLSVFSKLLEKNNVYKLISFINKNNILYKHQYGFISRHSTIHPIMHLFNLCGHTSNKIDP